MTRRPPGVSRTAWRDKRLASYLAPPTPGEVAARQPAAAPSGRCFVYCRVSTDAQAEDGQSLEVQRRQLEGWVMQRGQPIDQVVVEGGRLCSA